MASTYALPVSAMHHTHMHAHSNGVAHSHSLSPNKAAPSQKRVLRQERSMGSLHSNAYAESPYSMDLPQSHAHSHSHGELPSYVQYDLPPSPSKNGFDPGIDRMENRSPTNWNSYNHPPKFKLEPSPLMKVYSHEDHSHGSDSHDSHAGEHNQHHRPHNHRRQSHVALEERSRFTKLLLHCTDWSSLLQSVLVEKDSRRIFYFMSLNFAFMMIQAFYGFVTDSLGLLSDSIHMFFDCLALALGLFAAVSSRWPPSQRFPYGFSKIETLSGFGNGIFLILISIEIIIEAIDRLAEGRETKRLGELFIVSSLGLAVNLVGMACFGHHHHGHDHSHGDHSHSPAAHEHDHSCSEKHDHDHPHDHAAFSSIPISTTPPPATHNHNHDSHSHSHENDNMRGIFLHILADTMGSAAVVVSTTLIHFIGWSGWDPLASCIIAVLIFASSIPLVSSCAKRLLLSIPDDTEYQLRNTLADVSGLRGVASYSVPRFWMAEKAGGGEAEQVLGVIHVIALRGADLDDVRERTRALLSSHGMDAVIQVEREGDAKCWCGGDVDRSQPSSRYT